MGENRLTSTQKLYMCVCLITIAKFVRIENARESKVWLIIPNGIVGHKLGCL